MTVVIGPDAQEDLEAYEGWRRNCWIRPNKGPKAKSIEISSERPYNRSRSNWYEWELTAKPAGISSIVIVQQTSLKPAKGVLISWMGGKDIWVCHQ